MYPNAMVWAENFIEGHLEPPLLHGDEKHQEWLSEELRKWIPDIASLLEDYAHDSVAHI